MEDIGLRPWYLRLRDLMPHRVREILLVSSRYDAFVLEEDGPISEQLFNRYSELDLSWAPRVTHAETAPRGLELLGQRRFDLVIATPRLETVNVVSFGRKVKSRDPRLPVVVLTFSDADLRYLPDAGDLGAVDYSFVWTGDARILIAINKLVEDQQNITHDTLEAGVPVIIVVEDSARSYSTFLAELYSIIMTQARSLVAEGMNNQHKLLRMRARPKVVLARTYEEAMSHLERLGNRVIALISDLRFYREGEPDPEAGCELVETALRAHPNLPVLLQSGEAVCPQRVTELGVPWVSKNSPDLLHRLRSFIQVQLGFGDFVFSMPDGTELGRARDLVEMSLLLPNVPDESVAYHANRNDFSLWFTARSMFDLADFVRPRVLSDFPDLDHARQFLLAVIHQALACEQEGIVTDLSSPGVGLQGVVGRLGEGSLGGKGRGIAFANAQLAQEEMTHRFHGLEIRIPRTVVVGTEEFDAFLESNALRERLPSFPEDRAITAGFLAGRLRADFEQRLSQILSSFDGPLAVRSSSLLEDLQFQPFSGVYATYMLPNNHPDPSVRLRELGQAIKAVYASTFLGNARAYIESTACLPEEEKMGVVIQQMVGRQHDSRFYPHISGVGLSYNFYPVEGQRAEDGTALLALGLGHMVVTGGAVLRFSPRSPEVLPQFRKASDFARFSQQQFYALDMSCPELDFLAVPESSLSLCDLETAESDGCLAAVASVYSPEDDTVRDNLKLAGPRVITFNNVLKWQAIPLAPALHELLGVLRRGMGCAVEIEFAVDMASWGKGTRRGQRRQTPVLYLLQLRPAVSHFQFQHLDYAEFEPGDVLCRTDQALGHGLHRDLHDLVYVKRDAVASMPTSEIASQVGKINQGLRAEKAPFVLIGPGRWGTTDPRLGIPVDWQQIAGVRVIGETPLKGQRLEPSQGSHFFHNITSLGLGYLTLLETHRPAEGEESPSFIDMDWLDAQPAHQETSAVRHLRFSSPLHAYLDGSRTRATVLKPQPAGSK